MKRGTYVTSATGDVLFVCNAEYYRVGWSFAVLANRCRSFPIARTSTTLRINQPTPRIEMKHGLTGLAIRKGVEDSSPSISCSHSDWYEILSANPDGR